ncbi:hypothetical protein CY34DRAFT_809708 [Suillus luteus UH-Slu-Lm8-n1]|uniref:Uncharacterized protein n=1 Tax=Suillus luteus UH-Slu-Lm8-n1 TaxID=930992 RepID=A0A0D0AJ09_9AGAM|nr:hypothetical protein CY34DRAFT_809708 [Suillus luteus UH-Slu-Lm8-n1]
MPTTIARHCNITAPPRSMDACEEARITIATKNLPCTLRLSNNINKTRSLQIIDYQKQEKSRFSTSAAGGKDIKINTECYF